MPAEPAGYQLPGVLDQHDLGPEQGRVVADAADQAVAMIVAQVIAGHSARESGARRARCEHGRLRLAEAHGWHVCSRIGAGEVGVDWHSPMLAE